MLVAAAWHLWYFLRLSRNRVEQLEGLFPKVESGIWVGEWVAFGVSRLYNTGYLVCSGSCKKIALKVDTWHVLDTFTSCIINKSLYSSEGESLSILTGSMGALRQAGTGRGAENIHPGSAIVRQRAVVPPVWARLLQQGHTYSNPNTSTSWEPNIPIYGPVGLTGVPDPIPQSTAWPNLLPSPPSWLTEV